MASERFKQRLRDELLVDEPEEQLLVRALDGAVGITREQYRVKPLDGFESRSVRDRILTYLLGEVAAGLLRDGDIKNVRSVPRRELVCHVPAFDDYDASDDDWIVGDENVGYRLDLARINDTAEWLIENNE